MNIIIKGKNIELTPANQEYAKMKISSLDKFFDNIIEARIELGMDIKSQNKGKIYVANATLKVPNRILRAEEREKTLNKAIDKAKDDLQRELKVYKSKIRKEGRKSIKRIRVKLKPEVDEE